MENLKDDGMGQSPPRFRYYKVEGSALEILMAYKVELETLVADRQNLEQEFAERADQHTEYHRANLQSMWKRLAASVGLDPDKTWGRPEYQVEIRFLEDGFGAILYVPRHTNPLQHLLGDEPVGEPSDPTTDIPSKDITRH